MTFNLMQPYTRLNRFFKLLVAAGLSYLAFIAPAMGAVSQEIPCEILPKTIRAYSLIDGNAIRLVWPANEYRQEIRIARRVYKNRPSEWQNWVELSVVTDPAKAKLASEYRDTGISSGAHYEYQLSVKVTDWPCNGKQVTPLWPYQYYYQYINTGMHVPLKDDRGKLILLIENSLAMPLSTEITRLQNDLVADGYRVFRHDVVASEVTDVTWKNSVAATKALIRADYNSDASAEWTLFILGHAPVPYSGLSSPGGHSDNVGAHPADWYYADMDESAWTDVTVNNTTSTYAHHWNIPGDGKFDQTNIPTAPEMRVGRVDLRNMPAFGKTEVELIRQYLDRDHAWRLKEFKVRDRGLINGNNNRLLIYKGSPFDSHSSYASFFGSVNNADIGSWLQDASTPENSYLFAASAGNGEYTRDLQIGTTADFAATPLYVPFVTMYGSYYGDWDSGVHPDQVLQAPIATQGYTLTNYYHEVKMNLDMSSMGEPVAAGLYAIASNFSPTITARYTQFGYIFEGKTYFTTETVRNYVSLLGDPTLRERVVGPPVNVAVTIRGADNIISWISAADTNIQGYHVYRAPASNPNAFSRLTSARVVSTSFRDSNAASGAYRYMVRTVKLESSVSRTYYAVSQGTYAFSGSLSPKSPVNLKVNPN